MTVADVTIQMMTVSDITIIQEMARWQAGAQGRLLEAAYELFTEQGFEVTTAAQVAERAGVTERTFFRYFADKREVLFFRAEVFEETFVGGVATAPTEADPFLAAIAGVRAVVADFEQRREQVLIRQQLIDSSPELIEREAAKMVSLSRAVQTALIGRGTDPMTAALAADAGVSVFRVAFDTWAHADDRPLGELVDEGVALLCRLGLPHHPGPADRATNR